MTARVVGLLVVTVITAFGVAVVFNMNGTAQALIAQQRRQSYMRLFPWATSEAYLRIWAAVVALIGGAVITVVGWALVTGG